MDKLGFGAWQIGGSSIVSNINKGWTDIDRDHAVQIVDKAYDLGLRFFDTSCSYGQGRSEEILGEALSGKPNVLICTKYGARFGEGGIISHDFSANNLRRSLEESLTRLKRDSIDYLLMHNPPAQAIEDGVLQAFEQVKSEGLVRCSGISVSFIKPYLEFIEHFDAFELLYNPVSSQNLEFIPELAGKQVFFRSVFASGLLLKSPDFFLHGNPLKDWRKSLPDIVFQKAAEYVTANPNAEKRYELILDEVLETGANRVILGVSSDRQLDALDAYLKAHD